ncbi:MAG: TolC family protein [Kiritimatiellae bacterium]|nr:TolC family protein [Kiritimatiellia bacterium]
MKNHLIACIGMAGALALLGSGCMSSRYVDHIVREAVSDKAQSVVESSNTVEDAFAQIKDANQAPARIELDLNVALRMTARFSRTLQTQREQLYFQGLDTLATRRQFGPQYAGTLDYVLNWPENSSRNAAGSLNLQASQLLRHGGTLAANAGSSATAYQSGGTNGATDRYNNFATLSLTQPLMQGAGYEASHNLAIQAEQNLLYQLRSLVRKRQELAIDTMATYYSLLIQSANVANTGTNLSQAIYLRRRSEAMFRVGKSKIDDVFRAIQNELTVSNSLEFTEINLATSTSQFLIKLGLPINTGVQLAGSIPDLKQVTLDEENCIRLALELRLDLMTARDNVADAERHVRIARNALLPQIDAMGTANLNGTSDQSPVNQDYESLLTAGVSMALPLDKRNERDMLRRKRILLDETQRALDEKIDTTKVAIIDSFRKLQLQAETVRMQKEVVRISTLNVRATQMRFETGKVDNSSVVTAQQTLLAAKNAYIVALATYEQERVQLLMDIGLLDVSADGTFIELPVPKG